MTHTDQAFIEAYRRGIEMPQTQEPTPIQEQTERSGEGKRYSVLHGPHVAFGNHAAPQGKATPPNEAPLTDSIAQQMREAAGSMSPGTPDAATLVQRFTWPAVSDALANAYGDAYRSLAANLVDSLPSDGSCPVIGIAGIHHGAGSTTTALALTRSLANLGTPVGVVDASPGAHSLATSLGVLHTRPLSRVTGGSSWSGDATVHAAEDHVSLIVAGDLSTGQSEDLAQYNPQAAAAARMLRKQHGALVVDFGAVLDEQAAWQPGGSVAAALAVLGPTQLILTRSSRDLDGAVGAAQRLVQSAGASAVGVIENLVDTSSK